MRRNKADQAIIQMARDTFTGYLGVVHRTDSPHLFQGQAVPFPHHLRMLDVLINDELGHSLILAPRGSAKTTLVQWWVEWKLGRAKRELGDDWEDKFRVIYVSATARQAYKVSNAIKETIEYNEWYHAIFPHVKPHGDKWSEPEWKVRGNKVKDPNFLASGRRGPLLGSRGLYIILDDIVDDEVRDSEKEQEDTRFWLNNTVMKVLVPWGRMIMAATRWYEGDPPDWAVARHWHTITLKAIDEEGNSFWPERFPIEKLEKDQKEDSRSFALQMQNELTPWEGLLFQRGWFAKRFDYVPAPEDIRTVAATWDTAGTITGRSWTVGLVIIITKDWHYYIRAMYRTKTGYASVAGEAMGVRDLIRFVANQWRVQQTVIEAKSTGLPAAQELSTDTTMSGFVYPFLPMGQRGGPVEEDWVDKITQVCSEGRVHLPAADLLRRHDEDDWTETFLRELMAYPEGSNNDIVIALCQLLYLAESDRREFEAGVREALPEMRYAALPQRSVRV